MTPSCCNANNCATTGGAVAQIAPLEIGTSALERGIYNASVITIEKLAEALDVQPAAFLQRPSRIAGRKS
ncbi:MAG TPA: helix-turn-helix transcriptional regulator [Rhizomicrobium sp.]|nr:helix-turn-helix transcriptional regulator [Rhizomicrobium sp.]